MSTLHDAQGQRLHFSVINSIFRLIIDFVPIMNKTKIICHQILHQKDSIHNLCRIYIFKENSEKCMIHR